MTERIVLASGTPLQVAGTPDAPRGLLVIQEAFGVNDHMRHVAQEFADQGYYAVLPELFHRTGSPEVAYDDFARARPSMEALNPDDLRDDLAAAAEFLGHAGYPTAATGSVGYCMGGTVSFYANTLGLVGAAVTFYGGGVTTGRFGLAPLVDLAPSLRAPWLGLYGDLDQSIPPEQVEALRASAATASVDTDIVRYANADHGFSCDGRPAVYNAEASRDAKARTLAFFDRRLATK